MNKVRREVFSVLVEVERERYKSRKGFLKRRDLSRGRQREKRKVLGLLFRRALTIHPQRYCLVLE